jgi:hypothetical protein
VDAHPLIREHFAELLKDSDAWAAGHWRLYEHLCVTTKEGEQPTLEDLQPLYQAVAHGCLAGEHEKARADVYSKRILRGSESYSTKRHGAPETDLSALVCFFETPWSKPVSKLNPDNQAWILERVAEALIALVRLPEATECMKACEAKYFEIHAPNLAILQTSKLWDLALIREEITAAVEGTEDLEDGEMFRISFVGAHNSATIEVLSTRGYALHQYGKTSDAMWMFVKAEAISIIDALQYHSADNAEALAKAAITQELAEAKIWRAKARTLRAKVKILFDNGREGKDEARRTKMEDLQWRAESSTERAKAYIKLAKELRAEKKPGKKHIRWQTERDVSPLASKHEFRFCEVLLTHAERDAWRAFCNVRPKRGIRDRELDIVDVRAGRSRELAKKEALLDTALNQLALGALFSLPRNSQPSRISRSSLFDSRLRRCFCKRLSPSWHTTLSSPWPAYPCVAAKPHWRSRWR